MVKIFSKHNVQEVREWSKKLMHTYQLLHAIEKPMNLDYAKPFSNTADLVNMRPKIFKQLAEAREDQESEVKSGFRKSPLLMEALAQTEAENSPKEQPNEERSYQFIENARQQKGKTASKSDLADERESQEFRIFYQREHAVAYLQRKMPYHYFVYKRIITEL
mmetsp:Transcript_32134/g.49140  ORF Transcript_32134/g.49140 Transcript_32134/m.49140 type:complete len:163 (+) Transcript_32134:348-836(+)